jgi:DNA-binding MarR family transcriptional regulator
MDFLRREDPASANSAKALAYRLRRASHYIDREIRRELAPLGIELWELELLAALRRAGGGPPYRLTAGALLEETQLTSGAITKRVARLERKGWVRREIDPDDRRQILVVLTDEGLQRAVAVFGVMSKTEESLLVRLGERALGRMNDDLRELLLTLEGPAPPTP